MLQIPVQSPLSSIIFWSNSSKYCRYFWHFLFGIFDNNGYTNEKVLKTFQVAAKDSFDLQRSFVFRILIFNFISLITLYMKADCESIKL